MILGWFREWRERRQVFRELAGEQSGARDAKRLRFLVLLERAEAFAKSDQRVQARQVCAEIAEQHKTSASKSMRLLQVLLELRECDLAEELMQNGLSRKPHDQFCLEGYAKAAEWRGDFKTALQRWRVALKWAPGLAEGYARAADCLARLNRLSEAEAMLARGLKNSPDDVYCLIQHARIAESLGNYEAALARWQHLINQPADSGALHIYNGTIGKAQCLRTLGRLDEAEDVLRPYLTRFGIQEGVRSLFAALAEERGDLDEALKRYEDLTTRFPMYYGGYHGWIRTLERLGRYDDIDGVWYQMVQRCHGELPPLIGWAQQADRLSAAEVARRWRMVRDQFADCEEAWRREADALVLLGQHDAADASRAEHKARFPTS